MATRSTIALELEDGTVKQIYSHWDGYVQGVGEMLLKYYNTPALAAELISMGDLSSLESSLETTVFYERDRGETGVAARRYADFDSYAREGERESYNYIMREGVWYVDDKVLSEVHKSGER